MIQLHSIGEVYCLGLIIGVGLGISLGIWLCLMTGWYYRRKGG